MPIRVQHHQKWCKHHRCLGFECSVLLFQKQKAACIHEVFTSWGLIICLEPASSNTAVPNSAEGNLCSLKPSLGCAGLAIGWFLVRHCAVQFVLCFCQTSKQLLVCSNGSDCVGVFFPPLFFLYGDLLNASCNFLNISAMLRLFKMCCMVSNHFSCSNIVTLIAFPQRSLFTCTLVRRRWNRAKW